MPTYEYACKACGHEFEREQRITDPPVRTCPACRKRKVERLISRTSFVLKGSGWYSDLYSSARPDKAEKGDAAAEGASGAEGKGDAGGEGKGDAGGEGKAKDKGKGKGGKDGASKDAGKKAAGGKGSGKGTKAAAA